MKDIDDLKVLWKAEQSRADQKSKPLDKKALKELLKSKSDFFVAKMKRSLLFDFSLYIVTYPAVLFIFHSDGISSQDPRWWMFLMLGAMALVYFALKYRLLKRISNHSATVLESLKNQLAVLSKYLDWYLYIGVAVAPAVSGVIIGSKMYQEGSNIEAVPLAVMCLTWLCLNGLVMFPIYRVNKWYINKLYGKHLDQLNKSLKELDDISQLGHANDGGQRVG